MDGRKKAEYYTKICGVEPNATKGEKNKSHAELKATFFSVGLHHTQTLGVKKNK